MYVTVKIMHLILSTLYSFPNASGPPNSWRCGCRLDDHFWKRWVSYGHQTRETSGGPSLPTNKSKSVLGDSYEDHRCWLAMPLVSGFLHWVLACHTIEKKRKSSLNHTCKPAPLYKIEYCTDKLCTVVYMQNCLNTVIVQLHNW